MVREQRDDGKMLVSSALKVMMPSWEQFDSVSEASTNETGEFLQQLTRVEECLQDWTLLRRCPELRNECFKEVSDITKHNDIKW